MTIKRRILVRIISLFVALLLIIIGLILSSSIRLNRLETQIGYSYSMHLDELDGSLYNISLALHKALYASSATQLSTLAVELCTESAIAKNALSQLPQSNEELTNVNKFLSQVGDYTFYLSKKAIGGEELTDSERENLHTLSSTAQNISSSLSQVRSEYDKDGVWDSQFSESIGASVDSDFGSELTGLEELLVDYPSLIYDGPFSDHMLDGEMKMLKNAEELSSEEAFEKAIKILNIDSENFKEEAQTEGNVPCYNFSDGKMSFSVTKQGGFIIYMRKYREINEHKLSYEDAVSRAEEYLNAINGTSFVSTYYFVDEGVCTVNLAHKEGATVCYPDLVKVGVALDTGEIVLVEAGGYLANHYVRTISTPKYSSSDAKEKLSKALTVKSVRRCIIPTESNNEKHCYEFSCTGIDNEDLLVYINVQTLEEERIFLVLKTDGGTMTK